MPTCSSAKRKYRRASRVQETSPNCATSRNLRARKGQSPRGVIERYMAAENYLRQDFIGGMIDIARGMGITPQQIAQAYRTLSRPIKRPDPQGHQQPTTRGSG